MFSAGNGTEKKRVAQMNSRGMVIVDLYAGIGYFTLPYLVHGLAKFVHACEWNPDAVAALRRNLAENVRPICSFFSFGISLFEHATVFVMFHRK